MHMKRTIKRVSTRKPNSLTTLHHVPLFAGCSKKELAWIARDSDIVSFKAGRVLIEQGQPGREAFIITKGIAKVSRGGKTLAKVGAGEMVGELALLDNGPRTASVVCETDVEAVVISQKHLHGVLHEVPSLARKLLSTLAGRIRDLDKAVNV